MDRSLIVVVELVIRSGSEDEFMALVLQQARRTLAAEPDCSRFDVCVDDLDRARVLLFEIYASDEAFSAHLRTRHFLEFDAASKPLVIEKVVRRLRAAQGAP